MIPREPWMMDIQTSALTCAGVGLVLGLLMCVHSMQFQTIFSPLVHWRRRSTPRATYQSLPATAGRSCTAG